MYKCLQRIMDFSLLEYEYVYLHEDHCQDAKLQSTS